MFLSSSTIHLRLRLRMKYRYNLMNDSKWMKTQGKRFLGWKKQTFRTEMDGPSIFEGVGISSKFIFVGCIHTIKF